MGRQQCLNNDTTPQEEICIPQVAYMGCIASPRTYIRVITLGKTIFLGLVDHSHHLRKIKTRILSDLQYFYGSFES
jgi:hypothetical protein